MIRKQSLLVIFILLSVFSLILLTACSNSDSTTTLSKTSLNNIYGKIVTDTKEPIKEAVISLDAKYTTTTNSEGAYSLKGIPAGDYTWRVKDSGYQLIKKEITVTGGQDQVLNQTLFPIQIQGKVTIHNTTKFRASILQLTQSTDQSSITQSTSKTLSLKQTSVLSKHKESEIIIKYNSSISKKLMAKLAKKNNLITAKKLKLKKGQAVKYKLPKGKKIKKMITYYRQQQEVDWAIPNYLAHLTTIPDDNLYRNNLNYAWGYINANLEAAWDLQKGDNETVVAVLDSGIIPDHPDLINHLLPGADFVGEPNPELSFDITDTDPTDETSQNNNGSHGTHVAGIIGAVTSNNRGVAGVNWQINILPIRVVGSSGTGTILDLVEGIKYAIEQKVDIINLSLGFSTNISQDAQEFLQKHINQAIEAGITVVAAAGNGGSNAVLYPAAFDNVIAVGATNYNNEVTWYSNYGPEVDLVAPGGEGDIFVGSTWGYYENNKTHPGYAGMQGTSMATPYVSGIAALLKANGLQEPQRICERLTNTAVDLGAEARDDYYGYGLVDAYSALLSRKLAAPMVFAAVKNNEKLYIKSEIRPASDGGNYQLAQIEGKEVYIVGWRDVNENQVVDAGDYYGSTKQSITIKDSSVSSVNFDMYYVDESSDVNGLAVIE